MQAILLDSGADASIFLSGLAGKKGTPAGGAIGKLHGAQGVGIRTQSIQDVEIRLGDFSGRNILLRGRVAISDRISQQPANLYVFNICVKRRSGAVKEKNDAGRLDLWVILTSAMAWTRAKKN